MSDSEEMVREPWVFLLGVPPMEEYLSSLMQASGSDNPDRAPQQRDRAQRRRSSLS